MSDKGVVKFAVTDSPHYDAAQAIPLDSNRLFAFPLAGGDEPYAHEMADNTELVGITVTFGATDGLPYVEILRGETGTAKRLFERDYVFSVVDVVDDGGQLSNPRLLTFTAPVASGFCYIEIQEA